MKGLNIESEDFDTIGGFVTGILGQLPKTGETINYNDTKYQLKSYNKTKNYNLI